MKVLVLAGTSLARDVLVHLAARPDVLVEASLAGVTRSPSSLPVVPRIGGFGGADGFASFLEQGSFDVVIDATHPFAEVMTRTSAEVCHRLGVAHLILQNPPWEPASSDNWHGINKGADAAGLIPAGSRVFLGTGRLSLPAFSNLTDRWLLCRVIDPPVTPFPFPNGEFMTGKPPFSVKEEIALFQQKRIDWLVVKNAGTPASVSKLDAARHLKLPVAMIRRAKLPPSTLVTSAWAAMDWLGRV